ncbi:hypothetical protein [Streptomyces sp. AK04-3B]|nr:hypothetical protein [Streptomyces sp. AK04-3B]MDX3797332.1 hypothetical protein [Streptomyces sp. AK04-3B]
MTDDLAARRLTRGWVKGCGGGRTTPDIPSRVGVAATVSYVADAGRT